MVFYLLLTFNNIHRCIQKISAKYFCKSSRNFSSASLQSLTNEAHEVYILNCYSLIINTGTDAPVHLNLYTPGYYLLDIYMDYSSAISISHHLSLSLMSAHSPLTAGLKAYNTVKALSTMAPILLVIECEVLNTLPNGSAQFSSLEQGHSHQSYPCSKPSPSTCL